MNYFFIDKEHNIFKYYTDLINDINLCIDDSNYYIIEKDVYYFFVVFLSRIIRSQDLCILDSDFSDEELKSLTIDINQKNHSHITKKIDDLNQLLELVKNSTSKISIYTSGTTGKPKKIVHTINTLTRTTRVNNRYLNDIWAFAYNHTHIAGLQVFFQSFYNKNTLVNVYKKNRLSIYNSLNDYRVTNISATPTFYRLLLPEEFILYNVKRVTFGGEKSDIDLHNKILKIFPNSKITNIYASTEIGTLLHSNGDVFTIPEHIENDVYISDNELIVNSKLLGESDEIQILDGVYRTGDMVEIISLNPTKFKFISRKSEYVNVGGYKVNIKEVEDALNSINGIKLASVKVKPNSILGNVIIANIVLSNDNSDLSEQKIKEILKLKMQDFKIPRVFKFVEELEVTRTGKIK